MPEGTVAPKAREAHMKMILTAGSLALVLLLAAMSTVNAKTLPPPPDAADTVTILVGE